MRIFARFWFQKEDKSYLGVGRIDLLTRIGRTGSISKAAKEMGMSYKAAWDSVDIVNKLSPTPLVDSSNGGKGGGGSKLTPAGEEAIYAFNETERVKNIFFDYLDQSSDFKELLERLSHLESALQSFKPKN
ncbi:LysR family transcriptional regulator [Helicobacter sp. MIT 05-5293]|uniref:winged helix-turn-helix domain-containing protein n=1 Tax=Helicobacter sp. MIT 05-5293 TaxID=1548149 RepID=UPI0010FE7123|nr:LysR family transcriptional regulator [Helicobacter sp. MIT 05-5293]TLD80234.1 LysR family transcriptional regulator [Helicobacter sp. MIT 05-5293]